MKFILFILKCKHLIKLNVNMHFYKKIQCMLKRTPHTIQLFPTCKNPECHSDSKNMFLDYISLLIQGFYKKAFTSRENLAFNYYYSSSGFLCT